MTKEEMLGLTPGDILELDWGSGLFKKILIAMVDGATLWLFDHYGSHHMHIISDYTNKHKRLSHGFSPESCRMASKEEADSFVRKMRKHIEQKEMDLEVLMFFKDDVEMARKGKA